MIYCTKCGQKIDADLPFCTNCGAAVTANAQPAAPAVPPAVAPAWQATPVAPPQALAPVKKHSGLSLLLIVLFVLGFIVLVGIGGVVYVGYKVKQKVSSVVQEVAHPAPQASGSKEGSTAAAKDGGDASAILGNLSSMFGGGGGDDGDPVEAISAKDPVIPCSGGAYPAQAAAKIPLQEGTVLTTAWGLLKGDVEATTRVLGTTPASLEMTDVDLKWTDDEGQQRHSEAQKQTVCNEDLLSADTYATVGGSNLPVILHGVTRLRLSSKSFDEIKSQGKTSLRYFYVRDGGETSQPAYVGGILTRVEPQDVAYPMIVNNERVDLPAIHLSGIMEVVGKNPFPKKYRPSHSEADVYVVDDPVDPLVLVLRIKDQQWSQGKFKVEVIRINYKTAQPVNLVEKQLTEQKRAVTYGIYFDFNKDTIKPESEPVLKEIVQAMTDNPDWKLTVEGHTDNIGGDAYNLDLSRRRAAAVKQALVTQYHIAPDRLSTDGFGASRPVATNDTLEGRARNRRVELTRE